MVWSWQVQPHLRDYLGTLDLREEGFKLRVVVLVRGRRGRYFSVQMALNR